MYFASRGFGSVFARPFLPSPISFLPFSNSQSLERPKYSLRLPRLRDRLCAPISPFFDLPFSLLLSSLSPIINQLADLIILCVSRGFGTAFARFLSPPEHLLILLHQFLHIRMCTRVI